MKKRAIISMLLIAILAGVITMTLLPKPKNFVKEIPAPARDAVEIFKFEEAWGPCPEGMNCAQKVILFSDGNVTREATTVAKLSNSQLDEVKGLIKKNKLLTLKCELKGPRAILQTYYTTQTYTVSLDGATNSLADPVCRFAFEPIERILYSAIQANSVDDSKEFLVYERDTSWGPRPPGVASGTTIQLFSSGRVLEDGVLVKRISKDKMQQIYDYINAANLMTRECGKAGRDDLIYSFKVSTGGIPRSAHEPDCEHDFAKIEEFF